MPAKRYAAIDVGTNTIKVKITDGMQPVLYKDFPSCPMDLGHFQNCIVSLHEIKKILKEYKVDAYKCIATHALRASASQQEILHLVKKKTGFDIEVISGKREAE